MGTRRFAIAGPHRRSGRAQTGTGYAGCISAVRCDVETGHGCSRDRAVDPYNYDNFMVM